MSDKELIDQLLDLNNEEKNNTLLFFHQIGLEIGKEEAAYEIALKLAKCDVDPNIITYATNISSLDYKEEID